MPTIGKASGFRESSLDDQQELRAIYRELGIFASSSLPHAIGSKEAGQTYRNCSGGDPPTIKGTVCGAEVLREAG